MIKESPKNSLNAVNSILVSVGNTLAHKSHTKLNVTDNDHAVKARAVSAPVHSMGFIPTDEVKMLKIISELKDSNALRADGLITTLKKQILALSLSHLCNLSYESDTFSTFFKKSLITPIFKSGDKQLSTNYRPISILHTPSKVLENQLTKDCIDIDNHYGFRANCSTKDAVLKLT